MNQRTHVIFISGGLRSLALQQQVVAMAQQHNARMSRTTCAGCGDPIPPGKPGRKCRMCRLTLGREPQPTQE